MSELLVFKDQFDQVVTTIGDIESGTVRYIEVWVGDHEDPAAVAEQLHFCYGGAATGRIQ
jgi:hypothetical protein